MARVPVNMDLGGGEMPRPMASPNGISAPVATVQESGAMALARSLSAIQPELNGFLEEAKTDYREREAARAYDTIQGMTYDEAKEAVEEGTMRKTESPWFRAAFQKQFGLATAQQRRREIITAYNNEFDKQNGNLDEFLSQYAQKDYQAYNGSEFILSGLREGMQGVFDTVRNTHAEYVDGQLQTRAATQFYSVAQGAVDKTVAEGGDVNAALTALYAQHEGALGMTPDTLDGQALELAAYYAQQGDTKAVEAILNADPSGRGSFASRSGFATKAQELTDLAQTKAGEVNRTQNTNARVDVESRARSGILTPDDQTLLETWRDNKQLSQSELETILGQNEAAKSRGAAEARELNLRTGFLNSATEKIRSGAAWAVQDETYIKADGSTGKITGKELRDAVVQEQLGAMAASGNWTTAQMAQQLAEWGVDSNYPQWESAMTDGYQSLTNALKKVDENGKTVLPDAAVAGYSVWKEMAGAGNLRDRHVKDATAAAVYRDAEILESTGTMSMEDALIASASIDRKASRVNLATALDRNEFADAVQGVLDDDTANGGLAATQIEQHTRVLMDMNVPMDKAIEKAAESFEKSWTVVAGAYVNTRDRLVPPNLEDIATAHLDDFVETHPDLDRDEVFLLPDKNQDYWIVSDAYGMPIPGARTFHISDLQSNPRAYSMADANREVEENRQ